METVRLSRHQLKNTIMQGGHITLDISIDKNDTDCILWFLFGFNRTEHEGTWRCHLTLFNAGVLISDSMQSVVRSDFPWELFSRSLE